MAQQHSGRIVLYVGTYTHPAGHVKAAKGQGIYLYELNPDTGALVLLGETRNIDDPAFLAITSDRRYLYATSEVPYWPEGTVTAYAIDPQTGALRYINKQATLGSASAYLSIDRADRFVFVSNYGAGKAAAVFPIRADGGVLPASSSVQHEGSGVHTRQDAPHPHCILTDPGNRWVYVVDLGIDQIVRYTLDRDQGRLTRHGVLALEPGTGPRHMVFHPNGKFACVIGELNLSITLLAFEAETGALTPLQTVPTLPEGVDAASSYCSEIQVHPSGRFVYGGNRGHESLVIYAVDTDSGRLRYVGHQPTLGRTPRNFAIDPAGTFLLVGNQDSDTIVTFRVDQATGTLEHVSTTDVPTPVCLKIITL
jgi:6-phosphogluconolactonase